MSYLHLAIISPLLFSILIPFFYKVFRRIHTGWFVLPLPILLFIYFLTFIPITANQKIVTESFNWIPSLGINFIAKVDGLGLLFAFLITGIGALVVLYSIYYLAQDKEKLNTFYVYLLLFMGAMLGVVLSDNLIVMYAFWELTSFSSFLLIGFWYERDKSRYGAQKSMLVTVFGGLAMLGGIILLYIMTGTFSITEIITQSNEIFHHVLIYSGYYFVFCLVPLQSLLNFLFIFGFLMQWKHLHQLVPIYTQPQWSRQAFIWWHDLLLYLENLAYGFGSLQELD